ncbi:hypothetical protein FJTKL_05619 [Diaporthe vaccinii]|uniref:AB hydrolase-1 domain-containing protein n=1 Tax=Diaporthe vaccinii TaxID=105482 RepID=A0ABR4DRT6_9PEZI
MKNLSPFCTYGSLLTLTNIEDSNENLSDTMYDPILDLKKAKTPTLEIAYYEHGPPTGWPVVLSHGFPYSPQAFDEVVPCLTAQGARIIVPYLRGFAPTIFRSTHTMRTGQQAALGSDVIELLDALGIEKAILAGFDWGGVASCVPAALWPDRVAGLVSYAGYDIIDVAAQRSAVVPPSLEAVAWYQHLFQAERGRACLRQHRRELAQLLWSQWSPTWDEAARDAAFEKAAPAFANADFVDVVVQTYRFVLGNENGDPVYREREVQLARRPKIRVPTVTLDGTQDPLKPGGTESHAEMFEGKHERWEADVGHAFPLEAPVMFADAVLKVKEWAGW